MPARVVLVHDDPEFLQAATAALKAGGHDVAAFTDSMAAISALEDARLAEVLITRVRFPLGSPNGISLARMARLKRPGIKILFAALPEMKEHAGDLGEFMPIPVDISVLVEAVVRMLEQE